MPVLSVSIARTSEARLGLACLKYGVEAERIDASGGVVYADLTGTDRMTTRAAIEAGATLIDIVEYEEKPGTKFPGTEGTGIPLDDTVNRTRVYGSLMAGPR